MGKGSRGGSAGIELFLLLNKEWRMFPKDLTFVENIRTDTKGQPPRDSEKTF